jgi:hypothetical protein
LKTGTLGGNPGWWRRGKPALKNPRHTSAEGFSFDIDIFVFITPIKEHHMTDSQGWWYDRKKKVHFKIHEHTEAVIQDTKRYRMENCPLLDMVSFHHKVRSTIIPLVCSNGFIRIRLIQGKDHSTLGWQFTGEPHKAFEVLQKFAKRHDIGPTTEVTFTDFGLGRTLTTFWSDFNALKPPLLTMLLHWERTHLGGIRPLWSKKVKKDFAKHSGEDLRKYLKTK